MSPVTEQEEEEEREGVRALILRLFSSLSNQIQTRTRSVQSGGPAAGHREGHSLRRSEQRDVSE